MTKLLGLPAALEAAGVNVRVLDGWEQPAKSGYVWRESDGEPAGHMHHHTATTSYVPNRVKANAYAGLSLDGSGRLYQEDYDGGIPVYTIANAYPAPISSGAGDITVLARVREGVEVVGRQGKDTPDYYGNTHYWNTEWILDGIGTEVDHKVWEMMTIVCAVQNDLMGWTPYMHIGHGHHTRRKIDLNAAGIYGDFNETIINLRDGMGKMPRQQWHQMIDALFIGRPDMFKPPAPVGPDYWKTLNPDSSEWKDFWNAFVKAISNT